MTKDIQPGQSAKLTVTFKKGAYDIYCPIPGHKALGMNVNITSAVAPPRPPRAPAAGSGGPSTAAAGLRLLTPAGPTGSGSLASRDRHAVHAWAHVR